MCGGVLMIIKYMPTVNIVSFVYSFCYLTLYCREGMPDCLCVGFN